jgi:hypothetical protein
MRSRAGWSAGRARRRGTARRTGGRGSVRAVAHDDKGRAPARPGMRVSKRLFEFCNPDFGAYRAVPVIFLGPATPVARERAPCYRLGSMSTWLKRSPRDRPGARPCAARRALATARMEPRPPAPGQLAPRVSPRLRKSVA